MSKYIDENEKSSDGTVFRKRRSGFTIPRSLSVAILPHLLFHRFFTFLLLLLIFSLEVPHVPDNLLINIRDLAYIISDPDLASVP